MPEKLEGSALVPSVDIGGDYAGPRDYVSVWHFVEQFAGEMGFLAFGVEGEEEVADEDVGLEAQLDYWAVSVEALG